MAGVEPHPPRPPQEDVEKPNPYTLYPPLTTLIGSIEINLSSEDSTPAAMADTSSSQPGNPSVTFNQSEKDALIKGWQHVLVAKFSHGRPAVEAIKVFFNHQNLKGDIKVSIYDSKHIIVECGQFTDFVQIWVKKVWVIKGFTARFFKWDEKFHPSVESSTAPIWIHLPCLPLYFYDERALLRIASSIGRPLFVDKNNIHRKKLGYATICVEIDVAKPRIDKIWFRFVGKGFIGSRDGFWQQVIYDYIPHYCSYCHHLGHKSEFCKRMMEGVQGTEQQGKDKGLGTKSAALGIPKEVIDCKHRTGSAHAALLCPGNEGVSSHKVEFDTSVLKDGFEANGVANLALDTLEEGEFIEQLEEVNMDAEADHRGEGDVAEFNTNDSLNITHSQKWEELGTKPHLDRPAVFILDAGNSAGFVVCAEAAISATDAYDTAEQMNTGEQAGSEENGEGKLVLDSLVSTDVSQLMGKTVLLDCVTETNGLCSTSAGENDAAGGDLQQINGVTHVSDSCSLKVEDIQGIQNVTAEQTTGNGGLLNPVVQEQTISWADHVETTEEEGVLVNISGQLQQQKASEKGLKQLDGMLVKAFVGTILTQVADPVRATREMDDQTVQATFHRNQQVLVTSCSRNAEQQGEAGAETDGKKKDAAGGKQGKQGFTPRKLSSAAAEFTPKCGYPDGWAALVEEEDQESKDKKEKQLVRDLNAIRPIRSYSVEEDLQFKRMNEKMARELTAIREFYGSQVKGQSLGDMPIIENAPVETSKVGERNDKDGFHPNGKSFLRDEMCDIIPAFKSISAPNSPSTRKYSVCSLDYSPSSKAVLDKHGFDTSPYFGCRWSEDQ